MNSMPPVSLMTEFAPAERAPQATVHRQAADLARQPLIGELLNAVPDYVLILNQQRQIVFASRNLRTLVPGVALKTLLGQRPGEALGCVHADNCSGGCGTTMFCRECGAATALLRSLAGQKGCQECRMIRLSGSSEEAIDLLVTGTPLTLNGERYSLVAMADISHEKRRQALERVFFHDVINAAGGLQGRLLLLDRRAPEALREQVRLLRAGLHHVLEEIVAQRDLMAAEGNELAVDLQPVDSREILETGVSLYDKHPVARQRGLRVDPAAAAMDLVTDRRLLTRVLGNLIKNALEASQPGHVATVGCDAVGGGVRFWVHNPTFMPSNVQLQVFNRSFSTKGPGRGLGTYSVKLFTERYLNGRTRFTTSVERGTTFEVTLPRSGGSGQPGGETAAASPAPQAR